MKLKTVGVLCPVCHVRMSYLGPLTVQDTWLGYTRSTWCNECPEPFDRRSWLLLFNERKIFVGIVPGLNLSQAGNRIHDMGEISF